MRSPLLATCIALLLSCTPAPREEEPVQQAPPSGDALLALHDRSGWYDVLRWPRDCEETYALTGAEDAGLVFYPLAPRQHLVQVQCSLGAYQGSFVFFHYDQRVDPPRVTPLTFPTSINEEDGSWREEASSEMVGMPEFDASRQQLVLLTRYRGAGDCGQRNRYSVRDASPVLEELRAKVECDGQWVEPEQWPVIRMAPPN